MPNQGSDWLILQFEYIWALFICDKWKHITNSKYQYILSFYLIQWFFLAGGQSEPKDKGHITLQDNVMFTLCIWHIFKLSYIYPFVMGIFCFKSRSESTRKTVLSSKKHPELLYLGKGSYNFH